MRWTWAIELRGRDEAPHAVVKRAQRHFVVLPDDGVAQRGRELGGVEQLLLGLLAVPHGSADIQQQMADEVRLHLVLLDEILVPREVQPPVDVLGIIAPHVFPMPGELDGEPGQRRFVRPGEIAHHQAPRLDGPIRDPAQNFGIQITR